jgi:hypothetical protein
MTYGMGYLPEAHGITTHRSDHSWRSEEAASVLDDLPIHNRAMGVEQAKSSSLIRIHETHIARHVSVEDCCGAALHD